MGRLIVAVVGAASVVGPASPASAASTAVIGPRDLTPTSGATSCSSVPVCTFINPQIPASAGKVVAPFSGKIVRWSVNVNPPHSTFLNDGPLRLQVLKRTAVSESGYAYDDYKILRQTPKQEVVPGALQHFSAHLKIRKGQFIGLSVAEDTEIELVNAHPSTIIGFQRALVVDGPATSADNVYFDQHLQFNARVKRT